MVGPPGTGKTTYLARQVGLAVEAGEVPTVVSLTRAAAREAAGRDLPVDRDRVSTLHAQAYRAVDAGEIADTPKHIARWNEAHPRLMLSGGLELDTATVGQPASVTPGDELMLVLQSARARMEPVPANCAVFSDPWEAWKARENLLDFTDLIERALETVPRAPGDPTVVFADEAQDLSLLEMALVRKWADAAGRLIVVGDPWQNLYQWRGTDPEAMGEPDTVLSQSYRVPAAIHAAAMQWMTEMPDYEPILYQPKDEEGNVRRSWATWGKPQLDGLLTDIEADVSSGRTVMVLTTCDYMLRPLIGVLRDRGIPFHNPYRQRHGGWNPLRLGTKTKRTATGRVLSFLNPSRNGTVRHADVASWTSAVSAKHLSCKRSEIETEPAADELLQEFGFDWVAERLEPEALAAWMSGDLDWLSASLIKAGATMRFPIEVARRLGPSALEAIPLVVVGTIHSVKGGEADSVYLAPDLSASGAAEWAGQGRAGTYRAMYVGMTRAKHSLTILRPSSSKAVPL